jgi:hypothetical protein
MNFTRGHVVHALQEARRVLIHAGTLIDLRPICFDAPLEIVTATGCESTDLLDLSPGIVDDTAADNAIQMVLQDGGFERIRVDYFDASYYWNTVPEMESYIKEKWKDDVIFPKGVFEQACLLYGQNRDHARVRPKLRRKLGVYEKQ